MADVQKTTVEETPIAPAGEAVVAAPTTATASEKSADEPKSVKDNAEAAETCKTDDKKEDELAPIESGFLAYKSQGASFLKNIIPNRAHVFMCSDAMPVESLASYRKNEKSTDTGKKNIAWASHTGKGLFFVGDKTNPTEVINLADATEPAVEGSNKFHMTSNGKKHSFKAATTAERDMWVAKLNAEIAEAKVLAPSVIDSETFKSTMESLNSPASKEEKPVEENATAEDRASADASNAGESKDEVKTDEPKRRSASRKRTSLFGIVGNKEKKGAAKTEETASVEPTTPRALGTETPKSDATPLDTGVAATVEEGANNAAVIDSSKEKAAENAALVDSPKEKSAENASPKTFTLKRGSFMSMIKDIRKRDSPPVESTTECAEGDKAAECATTAPAAVFELANPLDATTDPAPSTTTGPTETVEENSVSNGEPKKDTKEKRKSSMPIPFSFGKRDKSPTAADGGEKPSTGPFSKLRATIKGKAASKVDDKEKVVEETGKEATAEEEPAKVDAASDKAVPNEASKTDEPETENKPDNVAAATAAVTAAA